MEQKDYIMHNQESLELSKLYSVLSDKLIQYNLDTLNFNQKMLKLQNDIGQLNLKIIELKTPPK